MKSSTIISKDEVISFIPEKLVISSINYEVNPICRRAYGLYHKSDLECIIFFLTLDKNNQSSFFKPYYDYLPKLDINIFPSEYSEEKLKLYEELEFDLHVGISNNKLKNAFNEDEKKIENGYEEFKYNYYLVKTRNFARPESEFFSDLNSCVPFIELFNHDNNYNLDWIYDNHRKGFLLKSLRNILPGEELTVSYGNETNINLFMTYGFTLNNNIYKNPIRVKIGKFQYSFYPSDNYENNKKDIYKVAKSLKEIYGNEKHKEKFIFKLIK